MNRHLQRAEQQESPSNLTKYCACHEILSSRFLGDIPELLPPIQTRFNDIRRHSDDIRRHSDDFRQQNRDLAPAASDTLLVPSWRRFCIEKYNISRSAYLPKCHEMLRLPRKVRFHLQQILPLLPKLTHVTDPHHIRILYSRLASSLYASILAQHLFSLGIYFLYASFLSTHLFSRHLFSLGIYSLLASSLSRHLLSLGWHLFSLGIFSLLASILSWHLFSLGI